MMEQTAEKLEKQIQELDGKKITLEHEIRSFWSMEETRSPEQVYHFPPQGDWKEQNTGDFWGSADGYLWLKTKVRVPKPRRGYKVIGAFDFDSIHEGYASGFESMLYIDGEAFQGVDENHKLVILDKFAGQEIELVFQLWMGITGGPKSVIYHQIRQASVGYLHIDTEDFSILAGLVLGQARTLPLSDTKSMALLEALNGAFHRIDWLGGREELEESVSDAYTWLKEQLLQYPERDFYTVHCVGHTHIDLAWMWQIKNTKEKAMRSFSTVMRLIEEFPDFKFYHSTPQLYEYIKEESPGLYGQIKEAVGQGHWEPGGAMWVESDCNLPSGEALVRQILYGKQYFREEFGVETEYVWLPDAFGFTFSLPQILKKSGIKYFLTSKLSWNKQNRFPHDTFWWKGIDKSRVLSYFLTTPAYGFPTQDWAVTYNGDITPKVLKGTYELYQEKSYNRELMMTYGHGDGGGGCTREMVKKVGAMGQVPFGPRIVYDQPGQFFRQIEENVGDKELPVYEEELYLEYHRGTFTSQAFVKRENRRCEGLLRDTELLLAWNGVNAGKNQKQTPDLSHIWKRLLKNQFHDIIPGSSIQEVYQDAARDYEWIRKEIMHMHNRIPGDKERAYTILNTSNWKREALFTLPLLKDGMEWAREDGMILETEDTWDKKTLICTCIQPFERILLIQKECGKEEKEAPLSHVSLENKTWNTPALTMTWNETGQITSLYDNRLQAEMICQGETANRLVAYEDKPRLFDAWDIDSYYTEKPLPVTFLKSTELVENTSLRTILRFTYGFKKSEIVQDVTMEKCSSQIKFCTTVDWQERQCLLKVYFPVNVHAREATCDIQFGSIKRNTTKNNSVEQARFEVCAHRFVDVSQRDRGMSLLNDCKYGHDFKDSEIGLTLIKSAVDPDPSADLGIHQFTYALYPHKGDWFQGETNKAAFCLNNPPLILKGNCLDNGKPLFSIEAEGVEADAVKRSEDGNDLILRLHEYGGGESKLVIKSPYGIREWCECDLMEQEQGERVTGDTVHTAISPYEIKTYRIRI